MGWHGTMANDDASTAASFPQRRAPRTNLEALKHGSNLARPATNKKKRCAPFPEGATADQHENHYYLPSNTPFDG